MATEVEWKFEDVTTPLWIQCYIRIRESIMIFTGPQSLCTVMRTNMKQHLKAFLKLSTVFFVNNELQQHFTTILNQNCAVLKQITCRHAKKQSSYLCF